MDRRRPGVRVPTIFLMVTTTLILALTCALETEGSVRASRGRSMTRVPSLWKRTRALMNVPPIEQGNMLTNLLLGDVSSNKNSVQSGESSDDAANSLLFLSEHEQPSSGSQVIESDIQHGRRNTEDFPSMRPKQNLAFFDNPQSAWNLARPGRRILGMNWNAESRSGYLAPDEKPYSSSGDAGQRALLSLGARKIVVEPEDRETWNRPRQKYWRSFRSLDDISKRVYLLTSKRQPPPGFHAIRGKRESEDDGAGQEDDDEAGQAAINRWIQQVTRRMRL